MRRAFTATTALTMLAVVVQFFLAGSGAFDTAPRDEAFDPHRTLGFLIVLLAVLSTIVGALAKAPPRLVGMTGLVAGLLILQPVIAGVAGALDESGSSTRAGELVFGLHAVNGLIVMALLAAIVRRSRERVTPGADATAPPGQPSATPLPGTEPAA